MSAAAVRPSSGSVTGRYIWEAEREARGASDRKGAEPALGVGTLAVGYRLLLQAVGWGCQPDAPVGPPRLRRSVRPTEPDAEGLNRRIRARRAGQDGNGHRHYRRWFLALAPLAPTVHDQSEHCSRWPEYADCCSTAVDAQILPTN